MREDVVHLLTFSLYVLQSSGGIGLPWRRPRGCDVCGLACGGGEGRVPLGPGLDGGSLIRWNSIRMQLEQHGPTCCPCSL